MERSDGFGHSSRLMHVPDAVHFHKGATPVRPIPAEILTHDISVHLHVAVGWSSFRATHIGTVSGIYRVNGINSKIRARQCTRNDLLYNSHLVTTAVRRSARPSSVPSFSPRTYFPSPVEAAHKALEQAQQRLSCEQKVEHDLNRAEHAQSADQKAVRPQAVPLAIHIHRRS